MIKLNKLKKILLPLKNLHNKLRKHINNYKLK